MISVVITAYNRKQYLDEAVASVFNQTRQPDEVIVITNFEYSSNYPIKHILDKEAEPLNIGSDFGELPRPYRLGLLVSSGILASLSGKYRYILLPSVSPTFRRESPFGQTTYTRKLYKPFARSPILRKGTSHVVIK